MAKPDSIDIPKQVGIFRSEAKCRAYLERLRWPGGVSCLRCGSISVSRIKKRGQFDCNSCRYQFSVTAGTYLQDSHLPLWKWLLATYMMVESTNGVSANQVKRAVAVSYKTAWYLCHRIRAAMREAASQSPNANLEAQQPWLRRERTGIGHDVGAEQKTVVGGVIHGQGNVRLEVVRGADRGTLATYHKVSVKHLDAYLDELQWRLNNRENPWLFRDTLLRLLRPGNLPYKDLIA